MKKLFVLAALAASSVFTTAATAGNASGKITRLTAYGHVVIFAVENAPSPAGCSPDGAFVIDSATDDGKAMYATLLTAVGSSAPISVYSSNTCPSWWANSELPYSVTIAP